MWEKHDEENAVEEFSFVHQIISSAFRISESEIGQVTSVCWFLFYVFNVSIPYKWSIYKMFGSVRYNFWRVTWLSEQLSKQIYKKFRQHKNEHVVKCVIREVDVCLCGIIWNYFALCAMSTHRFVCFNKEHTKMWCTEVIENVPKSMPFRRASFVHERSIEFVSKSSAEAKTKTKISKNDSKLNDSKPKCFKTWETSKPFQIEMDQKLRNCDF